MAQAHPYTWTAGDTLPPLAGQLEETNLTGYTITLRVARPGTSVLEVTATAVDLAKGSFQFEFGSSDLVAGLGQLAEVKFDDGGGGVETTVKFLLNVEAPVS